MHYRQIHHPTYKINEKMLKTVILDNSCIRPFFSPKFSFIPKENNMVKKERKERFTIGKRYSLRGMECDDFEMPTKEYELVGLVSSVNDINLDSVIMKQVSGNVGTIFSLTKNDCRLLNIDFQQGLQLFPKNLDWKEIKTETEEKPKEIEHKEEKTLFDENNMSTYPVNYEDRTIRHIMVEISGCNYIPCGDFIIMPDGNRIRKSELINKLTVTTIRPLYGNGNSSSMFKLNENIRYRIMTSEISNCTTNNIVDSNGNIYIELCLTKQQIFPTRKTIDGYVGVHPNVFDNQPFEEIFEISYKYWDSTVVNENKVKKTQNFNDDSLISLLFDLRKEFISDNDFKKFFPFDYNELEGRGVINWKDVDVINWKKSWM